MERETIQTERGTCGSGQQCKWACLPSSDVDPQTFYVSGAGGNAFSELVHIAWQKWRKGGGDKESEI